MKRSCFVVVCYLLLCNLAQAQQLDRLAERATAFWDLRVKGQRFQAQEFIEATGRPAFINMAEPGLIGATLASIEFTDDPTVVRAIMRVRLFMIELGEMTRRSNDTWVWDGKDWFFRMPQSDVNPFAIQASGAPEPSNIEAFSFEFIPAGLDLGRKVQGEIVKGRIEFRGERDRTGSIFAADFPGLTFGQPIWTSDAGGHLAFELDTALISESLNTVLQFGVSELYGERVLHPVGLQISVEPQVRFSQIPPVFDPFSNAQGELVIQNLTDKPFRIVNLVRTDSESIHFTSDIPAVFEPGKEYRVGIEYLAKPGFAGASLNITFDEPVMGRSSIILPIKFRW